MSVTADLLRIVDEAHSLSRILDEVVRAIAARFHVDACSAFLFDEGAPLRPPARAAAFGSEAFGTAEGAEANLVATRALAERRTVAIHGATSSLLASPMILRGNLVGAVVLQNVVHRDYSADDIATLTTSCAQLVTIVENARIIEALDRGERPTARVPPQRGSGSVRTESERSTASQRPRVLRSERLCFAEHFASTSRRTLDRPATLPQSAPACKAPS